MVSATLQSSLSTVPADAGRVIHHPLARAYELPFTLVLEIPVVEFTVGTLMHLQPGTIIRTQAQQNEDLSLKINGQLLGLVEFDVLGDKLAVRLTGIV